MGQITVYGAPWCPDCRRAKTFLGEQRIPYTWVDIDADAAGLRFVEELQGGGRTIPTIVFPDGSHLLEPSNPELAAKLGLQLRASRSVYDILSWGAAGRARRGDLRRPRGYGRPGPRRGALGGQAGATDRIDNYPGFPEGIGGAELADRLVAHASARRGDSARGGARRGGPRAQWLMVTTAAGDTSARRCDRRHGVALPAPGIPGEEGPIGLGVHYCATCDGPFFAAPRRSSSSAVATPRSRNCSSWPGLRSTSRSSPAATSAPASWSGTRSWGIRGSPSTRGWTGRVRAPRRTPWRRAGPRPGDRGRRRPGAGGGVRLRGPRPQHAVPARDRRPRRPRVRDHGRPLPDVARRLLRGRRRGSLDERSAAQPARGSQRSCRSALARRSASAAATVEEAPDFGAPPPPGQSPARSGPASAAAASACGAAMRGGVRPAPTTQSRVRSWPRTPGRPRYATAKSTTRA